jgi:hypothetical protein
MDRSVRLFAAVSLIVGFGLMTTPRVASAVPVVFSDGTFLDGEWTTTVLPSGVGGSGSAGQAATGGNPDAFREISITLVMPTSTTGARVDVVSIKPSAVYDPGTQAAIASIDYSEDAILLSGGGNGHALTLALEQAGVIYAGIPRLVSPDSAWSGAPIAFGFWRAFSSPPGSSGATRVGGIDNWMVAVQPVSEPGSALLVGLGLGLISACRRAGVA